MKKNMPALVISLIIAACSFAQQGALKLGELIDMPTAGMPDAGDIHTSLRMYPNGGFLALVSVGLSSDFLIGVSYGGENIIGSGSVNLNPQPCVNIKYRLFKEQYLFPAIVLGFHSQGFGSYDKNNKRYLIKERGFYAAASKNTSFLGGMGLHGGINWVPEQNDDKNINFFAGAHKWLNREIVVLCEYDIALNDNNRRALGKGRGYLNAGIRWVFSNQLFVEFDWKDILDNNSAMPGSSREFKISYITFL